VITMTTLANAHKRLDKIEPKVEQIDKDVVSLKTEVKIQFKEIFVRIKRIEALLIGTAGAIISMLTAILIKLA
jgi:tetrahydromethanopterin S-methyltransferase subunit G